ncbi:MAG: hypothetical protein F4Y26_00460 [Gammaproteobacteria bacterium]|nr:hypothetical protein [Gammaproteobacteria bacterium]
MASPLVAPTLAVLAPPNNLLPDNAPYTFRATITGGNYDTFQTIWTLVSGPGSLVTGTGVYTPPTVTTDQQIVVQLNAIVGGNGNNAPSGTLTSAASPSITVTIRHFGPAIAPQVTINAPSAISESQTLQLTTSEEGGSYDIITRTWTKTGGGGSITVGGLYTPANVLIRESITVQVAVTVSGDGTTTVDRSTASTSATATFTVEAVSGVGDSTLQIGPTDASGALLNKSMRITQDLRGVGSAGFNLRVGTITPEEGQIVAVRMGNAGRVFVGLIRDADLQTRDEYPSWAVQAVSYRTFLDGRYLDVEVTGTKFLRDVVTEEIVPHLVNQDITLAPGVPRGPVVSSPGAEISWVKESIARMLDDLMERGEYYWRINENKQLVFGPYSVQAAPSVLQESNVLSMQTLKINKTQEDYANQVIIVGGRNDQGNRVEGTATDLDEVRARRAVEGGDGVHQYLERRNEIKTQTEAERVAQGILRRRGQIVTRISFATDEDGYQVGQNLTVNLPTYGETGSFLIERLTIRDLSRGKPRYTIHARSAGVLQNLGTYIRDLKKKQ